MGHAATAHHRRLDGAVCTLSIARAEKLYQEPYTHKTSMVVLLDKRIEKFENADGLRYRFNETHESK